MKEIVKLATPIYEIICKENYIDHEYCFLTEKPYLPTSNSTLSIISFKDGNCVSWIVKQYIIDIKYVTGVPINFEQSIKLLEAFSRYVTCFRVDITDFKLKYLHNNK